MNGRNFRGRCRQLLLVLSAAAAMAPVAGVIAAQAYPSKVVRIVVPTNPGGASDIVAGTPAALAQLLRDDQLKWGNLIRKKKITAD